MLASELGCSWLSCGGGGCGTKPTMIRASRALLSAAANTNRRVLLIQAHPVADSFNGAIAGTVERLLKDGGAEVRRRDLYNMPDGAWHPHGTLHASMLMTMLPSTNAGRSCQGHCGHVSSHFSLVVWLRSMLHRAHVHRQQMQSDHRKDTKYKHELVLAWPYRLYLEHELGCVQHRACDLL